MEIQTGNPPSEGRYVAFVCCKGRQVSEFFEPIIATWHGGRWHCMPMVYGWIGPLPVGKCFDLIAAASIDRALENLETPKPEYDL